MHAQINAHLRTFKAECIPAPDANGKGVMKTNMRSLGFPKHGLEAVQRLVSDIKEQTLSS